jgi:hypothetical protein
MAICCFIVYPQNSVKYQRKICKETYFFSRYQLALSLAFPFKLQHILNNLHNFKYWRRV